MRLLLDTAASDVVFFECRLNSLTPQVAASGRKRLFLNTAGKEFPLTEVRLADVRLGPTELRLKRGFETHDRVNCGLPFDGVVGIAPLGLKWVAFD